MKLQEAQSVWERFACEVPTASGKGKAKTLKEACGAPACRKCISRVLVNDRFFACGRHLPKDGFDLLPIEKSS